jgi:uncharacterized protein Usg
MTINSRKRVLKKSLLCILLGILIIAIVSIIPLYMYFGRESKSNPSQDIDGQNTNRGKVNPKNSTTNPPSQPIHNSSPPVIPVFPPTVDPDLSQEFFEPDLDSSTLVIPVFPPTDVSDLSQEPPVPNLNTSIRVKPVIPTTDASYLSQTLPDANIHPPLANPPETVLPREPLIKTLEEIVDSPSDARVDTPANNLKNPWPNISGVSFLPTDIEPKITSSEVTPPGANPFANNSEPVVKEYLPLLEKLVQNTYFLLMLLGGLREFERDGSEISQIKDNFITILELPKLQEDDIKYLDGFADLYKHLLKVRLECDNIEDSFDCFLGTEISNLLIARSYHERFGAFKLLEDCFPNYFAKLFPDKIDPADYFLEQLLKELGKFEFDEMSAFRIVLRHNPAKLSPFPNFFSEKREWSIHKLLTSGLIQNLGNLDEEPKKLLLVYDKYFKILDLLDSKASIVDYEELVTVMDDYFALNKDCTKDLAEVKSQFPFLSILPERDSNFIEDSLLISQFLKFLKFSGEIGSPYQLRTLSKEKYPHHIFLEILPRIPKSHIFPYFSAFRNFVKFRMKDPLKMHLSAPCLGLVDAYEKLEKAKNVSLSNLMEPIRESLLNTVPLRSQKPVEIADFPLLLSSFKAKSGDFALDMNCLTTFLNFFQEYLHSLRHFYTRNSEMYFTRPKNWRFVYSNPFNFDLFQFDNEYLLKSFDTLSKYKGFIRLFLLKTDNPKIQNSFNTLEGSLFSPASCLEFVKFSTSLTPSEDFCNQVLNEMDIIYFDDADFCFEKLKLKLSSPSCPFWEKFLDLAKFFNQEKLSGSIDAISVALLKILELGNDNAEWLKSLESLFNLGVKGPFKNNFELIKVIYNYEKMKFELKIPPEFFSEISKIASSDHTKVTKYVLLEEMITKYFLDHDFSCPKVILFFSSLLKYHYELKKCENSNSLAPYLISNLYTLFILKFKSVILTDSLLNPHLPEETRKQNTILLEDFNLGINIFKEIGSSFSYKLSSWLSPIFARKLDGIALDEGLKFKYDLVPFSPGSFDPKTLLKFADVKSISQSGFLPYLWKNRFALSLYLFETADYINLLANISKFGCDEAIYQRFSVFLTFEYNVKKLHELTGDYLDEELKEFFQIELNPDLKSYHLVSNDVNISRHVTIPLVACSRSILKRIPSIEKYLLISNREAANSSLDDLKPIFSEILSSRKTYSPSTENLVKVSQKEVLDPFENHISTYLFSSKLETTLTEIDSVRRLEFLTKIELMINENLERAKDKESLFYRFRKHALNISLLHVKSLLAKYDLIADIDEEYDPKLIFMMNSKTIEEFNHYFFLVFSPLVSKPKRDKNWKFWETQIQNYLRKKLVAYEDSNAATEKLFLKPPNVLKFLRKVIDRFDVYQAHKELLDLDLPDERFKKALECNFNLSDLKVCKDQIVDYLSNAHPYDMKFVNLLDQRYKYERKYLNCRRKLQLQTYPIETGFLEDLLKNNVENLSHIISIKNFLKNVQNSLSEKDQALAIAYLLEYCEESLWGNFLKDYLKGLEYLKKLKSLLLLEPNLFADFCAQIEQDFSGDSHSHYLQPFLDVLDKLKALGSKEIDELVLEILSSFLIAFDDIYAFEAFTEHEIFSFSVEYLKLKKKLDDLEAELKNQISTKFEKEKASEIMSKIISSKNFDQISGYAPLISSFSKVILDYFGVKKRFDIMFKQPPQHKGLGYFSLLGIFARRLPQSEYNVDLNLKKLEFARGFGIDKEVYEMAFNDKSPTEIIKFCLPLLINNWLDDHAIISFLKVLLLAKTPNTRQIMSHDGAEGIDTRIKKYLPIFRLYLLLLHSQTPHPTNPIRSINTKDENGKVCLHAESADLLVKNEEVYFLWHGYLMEELNSIEPSLLTIHVNRLLYTITDLFKEPSLIIYPILNELFDPSNPQFAFFRK